MAAFDKIQIIHWTSSFVRALSVGVAGQCSRHAAGHFGPAAWVSGSAGSSSAMLENPNANDKNKTANQVRHSYRLLSRAKGASLDEICKATSWQPHSARAFLTGLRKKGLVLAREQGADEGTVYRMISAPSAEDASA
jgi:hypothetical protein